MSGDDAITLPAALLAPAHARAWVGERTHGLTVELLDDIQLIVSELVTNAVRHGAPPVRLRLTRLADGVRVSVGDAGPDLPRPTTDHDPDRPSGRGLLIVAATATRWGVEPHRPGPGKTVWADLPGR